MHFLPALTELVIGIRRPSVDWYVLSSCLGFSVPFWKGEYDQSYLGVYQGAQMAICEDRYGTDSLWLHLIDPDASHPALSGSFWVSGRWRNPTCMGYGPLVGSAILKLPNVFYWQLRLFSVVSPFQGDPSGASISWLVCHAAPFFFWEISLRRSLWRALRQMSMAWPIWLVMGWWCSCLAVALFAFIIWPCFSFPWQLTWFLYSMDLPGRLSPIFK